MKLSIIVPAYNVEDFIGRCLDSIFSQNAEQDSFEVICINDGSSDNTPRVIEEYTYQHNNLIYISRNNKGLSATRNEGLSLSTGDLIWYVDSDDAVASDSIKTIISYFQKFPNADFLIFDDIHIDFNSGKKKYIQSWVPNKFSIRQNLYEKPLNRNNGDRLKSAICQLFVYKKEYLINNNLYFLPDIIHEDDEIRMRMFYFAKEIRYIPYAHYIYTLLRPGSITQQSRIPRMKSISARIKTIENWIKFEKENAHSNNDKRFVNKYMNSMYGKLLSLEKTPNDSEQYFFYIKHKKEWKDAFVKTYKRSISISDFSVTKFLKYIIQLHSFK